MSSLIAALSALVIAASGPNPFLAEAKVHWAALDYDACLRRLEQGESWPSPPAEAAELHIYAGLCRFGLSDVDGAFLAFQHAATLDPNVTLPLYTSPKVRAVFLRASEAARRGQARAPALPDLTPRATAVPPPAALAPTPRTNRARVGPWTYVLGGTGVAALGAGAALGTLARSTAIQARAAHFESDARERGLRARDQALGANISYGAAVASLLSAGITWLARGSR